MLGQRALHSLMFQTTLRGKIQRGVTRAKSKITLQIKSQSKILTKIILNQMLREIGGVIIAKRKNMILTIVVQNQNLRTKILRN